MDSTTNENHRISPVNRGLLQYLQLKPILTHHLFTGPEFNTIYPTTQCELLYSFNLDVRGGYPQGDDFPNEFRPSIVFPTNFDINHNSLLSVNKAEYQNNYASPNVYPFNIISSSPNSGGITTNIATTNSLGFAVDKDGSSDRYFHARLWRNCPKTEPLNPPAPPSYPYIDIPYLNTGNGIWAPGCNTKLLFYPQPPNPIPMDGYLPFFNVSVPDLPNLDEFDEDNLKFIWTTPSNYNSLEHPASLLFELKYNAIKGGSKCQNIWINFEMLNAQPPNPSPSPSIHYELYDITSGNQIQVPSQIFLSTGVKYFLIDEVEVAKNKKYELRVSWNGCFGSDRFRIKAQYGVYCDKYGFPNDINLIGGLTVNSCNIVLNSSVINLLPPIDDLITTIYHNALQEYRVGCEPYRFKYKVENLQGDLSSARVQLALPQQPFGSACLSCSVSLNSVNVKINNVTYQLSVPGSTISGNNLIYEWDIIQILINKLNSRHFNSGPVNSPVEFEFELGIQSSIAASISANSQVNFTCSTVYNNTCNPLPAAATGSTGVLSDYFWYNGTPFPAFTIIQDVPYCSSGTPVNLAVQPTISNAVFSWTGPGITSSPSSSNINLNQHGNYQVTISTTSCPAGVTASHVVDDNTINFNLISTPPSNCGGSNSQYILENSTDPGTGIPFQPLYSYMWSGGSTSYPYTTPPGSGNGPFTVTVTYGGCTVNGSIVIPDVTPQISISGGGGYCEPSSPILSVIFASQPPSGSTISYLWSTGATASAIIANAPQNGGTTNYTVTVTVNGCTASTTTSVTNLTPKAVIVFDDHWEGYCANSIVAMHSLFQDPLYTYTWSVPPQIGNTSNYNLNMAWLSPPPQPLPASVTINLSIDNQGCISTTSRTINNITPSVQINSPHSSYNLCPGDPVNLLATVYPTTYGGGNILYDYLWSTGATSQSTTVTPPGSPSQWLFTVTVTNQSYSECQAQSSFQINNMDPNVKFNPPVISILPGASTTLTPIISNFNTALGYSYYWTYGSSPVALIPTQANSTQTVSPSATTTYYLDLVALDPLNISPACSSNAAVTVAISGNFTCPPTSPVYQELTQDILNGNIPPGVNASLSNGTVHLNANSKWFVTNPHLYLSQFNLNVGSMAEILFSKKSSIVVTQGRLLRITEGGTLKACGSDMWDGIYMQPKSNIELTGPTGLPVLIQDAEIGLYASGSSISITCHGDVTFDKNNISVHLESGNFNSAVFNKTKFKCTGQLLAPHSSAIHTFRHVELISAGTVNFNSGGSYQSNLFENAYTCIFSRNTNLNVKSCKFSNAGMSVSPNYIGTGIQFVVRTWSGMVTVPTLNVGYPNNGAIPNDFEYFEIAVNTFGHAHVKLFDNQITHVNRGVRASNNSIQPALLAGSIYFGGNKINNIKSSGIIIANNQYTPIAIISNEINPSMVNTPVDPLLETTRGIFIHNSSLTAAPATQTYLQWNTIINCKHGIQTMNQNGGQIENNTITYFISDNDIRNTTTVYRRGIIIQGCENLQVTHNTISRPMGLVGSTTYTLDANMVDISNVPNQKVSLCGIFSGRSQNCIFRENIINQLPTAVHMNGDNISNQFSCNHLSNGVEGFKLARVFMSHQGDASTATGNDWVSWPTGQAEFTRIMGTGIANHPPRDWWYLIGNNDHNPVVGVTFTPQVPLFLQPQQTTSTTCDDQPCYDCEVERLYNLLNFADTAMIEDALRYALENYVYTNLKDSLQLMYSGTIWDASLQNFFTARGMSNLGLLENVEELFSNDEYASSYLLNGEIEATNLVEYNLYEVNRICSEYNNEFDSLREEDRIILETIAYQYPDVGGPAVYRARAILGLDIDDTQLQYRILGEDSVRNVPQLSLYPNPAHEYLDIRFLNEYSENPIELSIFDVYGKMLDFLRLEDLSNNPRVDISSLLDGVYYIKVNSGENCLLSDKFVKITSK